MGYLDIALWSLAAGLLMDLYGCLLLAILCRGGDAPNGFQMEGKR